MFTEMLRKIAILPENKKYTKEEILTNQFLLERNGSIEVYYAFHNEYINQDAKVLIVGITPGWSQMEKSYRVARAGISEKTFERDLKYIIKKECRFEGSMRKNLIVMLNELKLHKVLVIRDCEALFNEEDWLLHTTSLIRYPVFINRTNYTGYSPKILNTPILREFVYESFLKELKTLHNPIIIPLGNAVEEVIEHLVNEGHINKELCLFGFPHPSGANGHRVKQLSENKNKLMQKLKQYFIY